MFYSAVGTLIRRYADISLDMERAGFTKAEADYIFERVKQYDQGRTAVQQAAGDIIDMKRYDEEMSRLLDDYVEAKAAKKLAELDEFSFLDFILEGDEEEVGEVEDALGGKAGVASTIVANVRRVINRKRDSNPEEYRKFSERLNRLLEEYNQQSIEYKEFLKLVAEMATGLNHRTIDPRLNTPGKQALYDNLGSDAELALEVDRIIRDNAKTGFRQHPVKQAKLKRALTAIANQHELDIETIMRIAINNEEYGQH